MRITAFFVYLSASIQQMLYESRMDELGRNGNRTLVYFLCFSKARHCALIYKPDSYLGMQHIAFNALSDGWSKLTDTGYLSHFFTYSSPSNSLIPSHSDMERYWFDVCHDAGLDLSLESEPFR